MRKKFFIKNLILFTVPTLIPLLILGTFSITITQGYIRNGINKNNLKMLNQAKETVELIFNELDSLAINFELDPNVIVKLKDQLERRSTDYEGINDFNTIMNLINTPVNSKPYFQSLYVYYENSKRNFFVSNQGIVSLDNFRDESWYDSFVSSKGKSDMWLETRHIKLFSFERQNTRLITLYKKLYSPGSAYADGIIVMNIKADYIDNILKSLVSYPDNMVLISGEKNSTISGTGINSGINTDDLKKINADPQSFFLYKSAKDSYVVSQIKSGRYQLKYISIIPSNTLYKVPIQLIFITSLLLLLSFVLAMSITYFITRRNHAHLNNIIATFESAEKGAPLPHLPSRIKDEYGFIIQNIIKTFLEHSYLKVQLSEKKYRLKAAEIMALQSQINPHFLFNTLKTIFWKSIGLTGDQNDVSKMIEHLSGILHFSLDNAQKEVPLDEEIKNTQSYIEIQKVRYKDKFGVIWQHDESILNYKVMKLLLQPFIENCIYHGIKEKEGSSYIKIKIGLIGSNLRIAVIDNGLGIERETLKKIREKLSKEGEYSEHIGLFNTNKRLKLLYGDEYGIKIWSKFGLGTVIYINIPVLNEN